MLHRHILGRRHSCFIRLVILFETQANGTSVRERVHSRTLLSELEQSVARKIPRHCASGLHERAPAIGPARDDRTGRLRGSHGLPASALSDGQKDYLAEGLGKERRWKERGHERCSLAAFSSRKCASCPSLSHLQLSLRRSRSLYRRAFRTFAHRRALAFSATFVVYVDRLKALVLVVAGQTVSPIVD